MALVQGQPLFRFPQRTGEKLQEDLRYCPGLGRQEQPYLEPIITTARYFQIKENSI